MDFFGVKGVNNLRADTLFKIYAYEHRGETGLRKEVMIADYYFDLILEHVGEGEYFEEMITPNEFYFDKPQNQVIDLEAIFGRHRNASSKLIDEKDFDNKNKLLEPKEADHLPTEKKGDEKIDNKEQEQVVTKEEEQIKEVKVEKKEDVSEVVSDKKQLVMEVDEQSEEGEIKKSKHLKPKTKGSDKVLDETEKREVAQDIEEEDEVEQIDYEGQEELLTGSLESSKGKKN